mmetsp:Transcript_22373/g.39652  ORF Transcript_22373/g.39652 Transcript_22373/m.39652 type:complete len:297 (+) Transcript_22373:81-971(+)
MLSAACRTLSRVNQTQAPHLFTTFSRMSSSTAKVYAVRVGRKPGIFNSWAACKAQVDKFPGAVYKSFKDMKDAKDFIGAGNVASKPPAAPKSSKRKRSSSSDVPPKSTVSPPKPKKKTKNQSAVPKLPPGDFVYTDGACPGNNNVEKKAPPAGWGFCYIHNGEIELEAHGAVITCPSHKDYVGAEVGSNNTGEITAITKALYYALKAERTTPLTICCDSTYAINIVLGNHNAKTNKKLVERTKEVLGKVGNKRSVQFKKVKGHSGDFYNDIADKLAVLGAKVSQTLPADLCAPRRT